MCWLFIMLISVLLRKIKIGAIGNLYFIKNKSADFICFVFYKE